MTQDFKELIGNVLKGVWVNADHLTLELEDAGMFHYTVDGDCCSHSYFYAVTGVDKVLGKKIVSVEEIDLHPGENLDDGYDSIASYGYKISAEPSETTLRSGDKVETSNSMFIEFRNSSNGYYGGSLNAGQPVAEPIGEQTKSSWESKE